MRQEKEIKLRIGEKITSRFDFYLFGSLLMLIFIGLVAIYSCSINVQGAVRLNFYKQLIIGMLSVGVFFAVYNNGEGLFKTVAYPSYWLSIFLLLIVFVIGKNINNSKSWIGLGVINFQPSELAKIAVILTLAKYLSEKTIDLNNTKEIIKSFAIGFIPTFLIILENDMGTAFVFCAIILAMFFYKGFNPFALFIFLSPLLVVFLSMFGTIYLVVLLICIFLALCFFRQNLILSIYIFLFDIASSFFFQFIFNALSPHQKKRVIVFLNPDADPLGAGYNVMQAKVAIGSGGLFGKGFMNGNQTQLRFIPEQWTDFIHSVVGEEWGFIGSSLIVILFFVIFSRMINLFTSARTEFGGLVAVGIFTYFFFQFMVNMGMTIGLMPVIGLPLPFISYGGSSLLINMLSMGIIAALYKQRL